MAMSDIRMSDVFELPMSVDGHSVESEPSTPLGSATEWVSDIECDSRKDAEYVAHAINKHDKLVDRVKELEDGLKTIISLAYDGDSVANQIELLAEELLK